MSKYNIIYLNYGWLRAYPSSKNGVITAAADRTLNPIILRKYGIYRECISNHCKGPYIHGFLEDNEFGHLFFCLTFKVINKPEYFIHFVTPIKDISNNNQVSFSKIQLRSLSTILLLTNNLTSKYTAHVYH